MNTKALEIIDRIVDLIHDLARVLVGTHSNIGELLAPGLRQWLVAQGPCKQCGRAPVMTVADDDDAKLVLVTVICHDEFDVGKLPYDWYYDDRYHNMKQLVQGLLPTRL